MFNYDERLKLIQMMFKILCIYISGFVFLFFLIVNSFHTPDESLSDKIFGYTCLSVTGLMFLPALLFFIFFSKKTINNNPYESGFYAFFTTLDLALVIVSTGLFFINGALNFFLGSIICGLLILVTFIFQLYYFYFNNKEIGIDRLAEMSKETDENFIFDNAKNLQKFTKYYRKIMILPKSAVVAMVAVFLINVLLFLFVESYPISISSGFYFIIFFITIYFFLGLFSYSIIFCFLLPWQFEKKFKKKLIMI